MTERINDLKTEAKQLAKAIKRDMANLKVSVNSFKDGEIATLELMCADILVKQMQHKIHDLSLIRDKIAMLEQENISCEK